MNKFKKALPLLLALLLLAGCTAPAQDMCWKTVSWP